jgi:lipopolysaccharide transport system ATP-binding protein
VIGLKELVFDADDASEPIGGAEIESSGFFISEDSRLDVAAGGETVELCVRCRTQRALRHVSVAFVVRDRLGQIIFSDDTFSDSGIAAPDISADQSFVARFAFVLPYLASGAYAIEAFLFECRFREFVLVQRRLDREFLYVQSTHISNGLANLAMRSVSLETVAESSVAFKQTTPILTVESV